MLTSHQYSFIFLLCFDLIQAKPINNTLETKILDKILDSSQYDASVPAVGRDPTKSEPMEIKAQVLIRYINYFDDMKQEVSVQILLRLWWSDSRHRYDNLFRDAPRYVRTVDSTRLWYPDVFILNGKTSFIHDKLKPNINIRIYKNGRTYFSTRITVVLYCSLDLQWHPFDKQKCPLRLELYSLNKDEAYLVWNPSKSTSYIIGKDRYIPMFELKKFYVEAHNHSNYIEATLEFNRRISIYITKVFVPFFLLVFVSISALWLERMDTRLALGITTILATTTQMSGLGVLDPAVAYIKALDIYTSVCQWFVTAAFLESAIVSMMIKKYRNRAALEANLAAGIPAMNNWIFKPKSQGSLLLSRNQQRPQMIMTTWTSLKPWDSEEVDVGRTKAVQIDRIAKIVFPTSFILFASVYFLICFSHE